MEPLEQSIRARAPQLVAGFADPVGTETITAIETLLGRPLPADYLAFLHAHDGQRFVAGADPETGTLAPLFRAFDILPGDFACSEWESMQEWGEGPGDIATSGPVRPLYTHPAWWPITVIYGSSHHHCVDLDPAPGGHVGQIIVVSMKDDQRAVIAPSFAAFIELLVAAIAEPGTVIEDDGIELDDTVLDRLGA